MYFSIGSRTVLLKKMSLFFEIHPEVLRNISDSMLIYLFKLQEVPDHCEIQVLSVQVLRTVLTLFFSALGSFNKTEYKQTREN